MLIHVSRGVGERIFLRTLAVCSSCLGLAISTGSDDLVRVGGGAMKSYATSISYMYFYNREFRFFL